jgi:hypothetical protein
LIRPAQEFLLSSKKYVHMKKVTEGEKGKKREMRGRDERGKIKEERIGDTSLL